jgi:hypothetical protein
MTRLQGSISLFLALWYGFGALPASVGEEPALAGTGQKPEAGILLFPADPIVSPVEDEPAE